MRSGLPQPERAFSPKLGGPPAARLSASRDARGANRSHRLGERDPRPPALCICNLHPHRGAVRLDLRGRPASAGPDRVVNGALHLRHDLAPSPSVTP